MEVLLKDDKKIDLQKEFEIGQKYLADVVDNFGWENPKAYGYWLGQTYYYVCKSTRILALASAHFPLTHNKYHYRFIEHAREEKGHEKLLTLDLKSLNMSMNDIPELPEMSAFYQCLYYWIEHINPIGLFGWVFCLEGLAVTKGDELYKRVKDKFGEKAASFWKVHSGEDVKHLQSAFDVLQALTEEEKRLILTNYWQCCTLYAHVFKRITEICENETLNQKSA